MVRDSAFATRPSSKRQRPGQHVWRPLRRSYVTEQCLNAHSCSREKEKQVCYSSRGMLKLKEREPKVHRQAGRRGNERPTSSTLAPAGRGPGGIRDELECEFDSSFLRTSDPHPPGSQQSRVCPAHSSCLLYCPIISLVLLVCEPGQKAGSGTSPYTTICYLSSSQFRLPPTLVPGPSWTHSEAGS